MMSDQEHKIYCESVRAMRAKVKQVVHPMFVRTPINSVFAKTDKFFNDACKVAKVEPTTRQASKFRNKSGAAYNFGRSK